MINLPLNIDFSGKVVVVTGAGGLICGAMARAFAQSGAKVAALDLNEEAVKKLAEELKADKEIVLKAVSNNGIALEYASYWLRGDKEIALKAVKNNIYAVKYVLEELRGDKEVILEVICDDGTSTED